MVWRRRRPRRERLAEPLLCLREIPALCPVFLAQQDRLRQRRACFLRLASGQVRFPERDERLAQVGLGLRTERPQCRHHLQQLGPGGIRMPLGQVDTGQCEGCTLGQQVRWAKLLERGAVAGFERRSCIGALPAQSCASPRNKRFCRATGLFAPA